MDHQQIEIAYSTQVLPWAHCVQQEANWVLGSPQASLAPLFDAPTPRYGFGTNNMIVQIVTVPSALWKAIMSTVR